MELSEELGVGIEQIKTFLPTTRFPYLGFTLDSDLLELSLPEEKLFRVDEALEPWYNGTTRYKKRASLLDWSIATLLPNDYTRMSTPQKVH